MPRKWTPEEKLGFRALLIACADAFNCRLPQDERALQEFLAFYTLAIEEVLTPEEAVIALKKIMQGEGNLNNLRRLPTPADLIRIAKGDPTERAQQVWREVISAMERVGAYHSIRFRDPIVNAVVKDLGGWPELCRKSYIDLEKTVRWEFCKLYCNYWHKGEVPLVPYLPGLTELENRYLIEQGLINDRSEIDVELVEYGTHLPPGVRIRLVKPPDPERYLLTMEEVKRSLGEPSELPQEVRDEISRIALEGMAYVTRSKGH